MRTSRIAAGAAAVVATAGLVLAGTGVAAADEGTTPKPTQGPITLSAEEATQLCTVRIPAALARIDRLQKRLDADTGKPGSTAWLTERVRHLRAEGRTQRADQLQKRLDGRPAQGQKLADAEKRLTAFKAAKCI